LIDEHLPKVEECAERSRARFAPTRCVRSCARSAMQARTGPPAVSRTAAAVVKQAYQAGRVRVHPPWVAELGRWLRYDYG
jgi:hypothetical protein